MMGSPEILFCVYRLKQRAISLSFCKYLAIPAMSDTDVQLDMPILDTTPTEPRGFMVWFSTTGCMRPLPPWIICLQENDDQAHTLPQFISLGNLYEI